MPISRHFRTRPRTGTRTGPRTSPRTNPRTKQDHDRLLIYGVHAALAALANPQRRVKKVWVSSTINASLHEEALYAAQQRDCPTQPCSASNIEDRIAHAGRGRDAVHQGLLVEALPLHEPSIEDITHDRRHCQIIACDQIVDPRNLGAIARSAVVLGADALVMTKRHTPPLDGALAKAACGALEHIPCLRPANLRQSLQDCQKQGFFIIGLAEEGSIPIDEVPKVEKIVIVLGAEHAGLRRLTREQCDQLVRIPTTARSSSATFGMGLNVSNAAAIALHILSRHRTD